MLLLMSALSSATPAVSAAQATVALPSLQPVVLGAKKKGGKKKKK